MRKKVYLFFLVLFGAMVNIFASNTNTNQNSIAYIRLTHEFQIGEKNTGFWSPFPQELEKNGGEMFADRFLSPSKFRWLRRQNEQGYGIYEIINNSGKKLFIDTVLDSMRETAVAWRPFSAENWEEFGQQSIAKLFSGSVGNTVEERVDPVSISPTYSAIHRSWWKRAKDENAFSYGIRPWDGYSYIDADIGKLGDRPLFFSDFRISTPIDGRIGSIKIQEQIIIPLIVQSELVLGGSFDPTKINSSEKPPTFSARIQHIIKKGMFPGAIYAGTRSEPFGNGSLILLNFGFFFAW